MAEIALVTGASQGIGRAICLELAGHGYDLVMAARELDRLEETAAEVRSLGRQALAVSTDVRDRSQVKELVAKAILYYGRVDVLVNNAGIYFLGPVEDASDDDWQQIIQTNLWGYIHTIQALLPHFLERGSGTIVNISSIGGITPLPYQVPYTTSKYAITGLTKSLRAEVAPKGIQVCGIYPSFIRSRVMERAIFRGKDAQQRAQLVEQSLKVPLIEKPEDVAKATWDAIRHRREDVLVGSANIFNAMFKVMPGVMQPMIRQVFGMGDR